MNTAPMIPCRRVSWSEWTIQARWHRRFLSRQLDAIFVALKLYQVSNMFETPAISRRQIALKIAPGLHVRLSLSATKTASSCRDKNRLCKRAFTKTRDDLPRSRPHDHNTANPNLVPRSLVTPTPTLSRTGRWETLGGTFSTWNHSCFPLLLSIRFNSPFPFASVRNIFLDA